MKLCKQCSQQFQETYGKTIFCSHKCQAKWAVSLTWGKPRPGRKKGKILECIMCKKEFYIPKWRLLKGDVKYCSRSCLAKNHLPKYVKIHGFKPLGKPHHTYKTISINGKQVREHRYIMEQHLGRKLERWEHVHHVNDNSLDNRIENLQLLSNSDHIKLEHKFRKKITFSS